MCIIFCLFLSLNVLLFYEAIIGSISLLIILFVGFAHAHLIVFRVIHAYMSVVAHILLSYS